TLLLAAFGGLALVLAAIGIYGVIAYSVTQRTQEIGIRMALGAQRWHVLMMVMRHGTLLVVVGLGIGLFGSLLVARALSRFLFAIGPGDPLAFALAMILLACVGLAAAMIPALRATKIDPLVALRYE